MTDKQLLDAVLSTKIRAGKSSAMAKFIVRLVANAEQTNENHDNIMTHNGEPKGCNTTFGTEQT